MFGRQAAFAAMLMVSTAACGGRGLGSPSAPAAVTGPSAITGATIQGQVQTGTPMLAATTGAAASALTVTVVGTSLSAPVSGTGQFTLTGVPEGCAQLNISGPGVNATVNFAPVKGTETIALTVKLSGNQAEVESEIHDDHGDAELHGIVLTLTGSSNSFDFFIGGTKVHGDARTTFFGDGDRPDSFSTLRSGNRVEVKGATQSAFVYAQRIHINGGQSGVDNPDDHGANGDDPNEDANDDHGTPGGDKADDAEASGTISGLTSGCPSISFSVGSAAVSTDSSTKFKGAACSALRNGDRVKVEGKKQTSGAILASEVKKQ